VASGEDWRVVAERVRNWGRWGPDDELGTLNYISPARIAAAARLVKAGRVIPLGIPINAYGPQGAHGFRRNPIHLMSLDGGDDSLGELPGDGAGATEEFLRSRFRTGPMRFNDDYIMMPTQSGTQWDALSHVYYDGLMYNGHPATAVTSLGASRNGIDKVADRGGVIGRGVLLDVPQHHGEKRLPPNYIITPAQLDEIVAAEGVQVGEGDIVVLRTGWRTKFLEEGNRDDEWFSQSPGLSWKCAEWLHDRRCSAVAADTMGIEVQPPETDTATLFHLLALRDMGMSMGEIWDLERLGHDCAQDKVYEFMLVATALNITGGTGTPVSPVAIK
jgi:kynurenine formamidase